MRSQLEGEVSVVVLDFLVPPLTQIFFATALLYGFSLRMVVYSYKVSNGGKEKT